MRKLQLVLLVAVVGVVQTAAKLCPYNDQICRCSLGSMTCSNLQQIPPIYMEVNVSQITEIYFENGNITSITKPNLPPNLREIAFYGHPLDNISADAFEASAATLQRLYISEARFNNLPKALKQLTNLTELDLSNIPMQSWDASILQQLAATLEHLRLMNVSLSAWPSWISDFHSLRSLDLGGNSLKSISDDAFSVIKDSLTHLHLSSTGLTHVPQALSVLTSLNTLDLSTNNFTEMAAMEWITGSPFAPNLSYLYLTSAGLTTGPNLSNLTSLRSIVLTSNSMSDVPPESLPESLTSFYLQNNSLSSVPKDVANMSGLLYVFLSSNLITEIKQKTFPSSSRALELSANNLTIITNESFRSLNHLRILFLDSNPIATISPSAFADLVSLRYLSIADSHLTEMSLAFTQLSPQTHIYLTTSRPLSCPCPAPHDLVTWFASLTNTTTIQVSCSK
ncbi:hypothetical protein BsWGS_16462 [Bradybaena similaris]